MDVDANEVKMSHVAGGRTIGTVLLVFLISWPAHSAPIRFGDALETALKHSSATGQPNGTQSCPVPLQDFSALAAQLDSANEMGLPAGGPNVSFTAAVATPFALATRRDVILCTALVYAKLEDIQSRQRLMQKQEALVRRLMNIESRRVSAEVDQPLLLVEAKVLRAKTRMASTSLDASELAMRTALGSLLASPADSPSAVEDSMPPLPQELPVSAENDIVLQRMLAFRDIVQLEYVSGFLNRQKAGHDVALARATIGAFVAAQVDEIMKFAGLVQFNNQVRLAKIQFLGSSDGLANWATGITLSEPAQPAESNRQIPAAASDDPPRPLSIMIVPGIEELPIGKTQQYSVVETDTSGHARDVSTEATWLCSTDSSAVLSSTGLLTALSSGQLTIRVEYKGLVAHRKLSIPSRAPEEDSTN